MSIDRKLLDILRCPISKQSLRLADKQSLAKINAHIARGDIHSLDGTRITESWDAALITVNGTTAYPIKNGWPVMLVDKSLALDQLASD
jgi:uncharacterized protein YbaR (Trm112 family)